LRTFTVKELGISHPILATDGGEPQTVRVPNPDVQSTATDANTGSSMYGPGGPGALAGPDAGFGTSMPNAGPGVAVGPSGLAGKKGETEAAPAFFEVKQTTFTVQFCWTPKPRSERLAAQEEAAKLKAAADAEAAANAPPPAAVNEGGTNQAAPVDAAAPAAGPAPAAAPAAGPAPVAAPAVEPAPVVAPAAGPAPVVAPAAGPAPAVAPAAGPAPAAAVAQPVGAGQPGQ
jgi:hypothetical protein